MRILLVNWQDRDNPLAGGAEIHLHEIFGRIASRGHAVTLLCGGWPGCPARATLDGIDVHRVGTRHSFPFLARSYYETHLAGRFDVIVEDVNKVPLYTPLWGAPCVVTLVPHLFGGTAFQELAAPLAAAVWLAERPLGFAYQDVPFQAISESTRDDLAERGIDASHVEVIYPGIDTVGFTPAPGLRSPNPLFAYLGRLKKYKGVDLVIRAFARVERKDAVLEIHEQVWTKTQAMVDDLQVDESGTHVCICLRTLFPSVATERLQAQSAAYERQVRSQRSSPRYQAKAAWSLFSASRRRAL